MIQSIERAALVLESLKGERHLGITEIAERLDLKPLTVHGIVKTLVAHGLVVQEKDGPRYQLGPALLRLSSVFLDNHEVRGRSLRWMAELAERTGCAIRLGVELFEEVMVIHHVARPDGTHQMAETGISIPAHASALGKVLIAYDAHPFGDVLADSPLRSLTGETVTELETLRTELDEVRRRGFAIEREEAVLGESSLAAPIADRSGHAVAAVAIVLPASAWRELEPDPAMIDALRETARGISRDLGCGVWPPRQ